METLSLQQLNRATLARQLLLERRKRPLLKAVETIGGMQAQWVPAPYVGLWTRLPDFQRASLDKAIAKGDVVKALMMRGTLHLVTAKDYPLLSAALYSGPDISWDSSGELGDKIAGLARKFLAGEPRSRAEVIAWLEEQRGVPPYAEWPRMAWYTLRAKGHVVHSAEAASWKPPRVPTFTALKGVKLPGVDEARKEFVRRYLAAFGPATKADIADWSGMRVGDFAPALEALKPLKRFKNEEGKELLDLPRAPRPDADTPVPVRFLPKWDSTLLGHKDRRRILPEEYRKTIIGKNGDVAQTYLIDGMVAGTWAFAKGKVTTNPFVPVPRKYKKELDAEAKDLAAFLS